MRDIEQQSSPRAQDPEQILGKLIGGGYRVVGFLGQGGMGVIYLARQEALQRDVILKVIRSDLADEDAQARFRREAHSLSLLSHPNVVQVYDHGLDRQTGLWFIVMEYVRGITLARFVQMRRGPLPVEEFAPIARQIVDGVAEAHRHQLIHRDLKLANVMLTSADGARVVVKILDFGLSRLISTEEQLTQANYFAGSAMYLAPEVMKNGPIDTRVDVYALGVVFFKLLSGRDPIEGENAYEILMGHATGAVRPLGTVLPANHSVPAGVIAMVDRCLAGHPDQRPMDARDLSMLLNTALRGIVDDASEAAQVAANAQDIAAPSQSSFSRRTMPSMTPGSMYHTRPPEPPQRPRVAVWVAVSAGVLAFTVLLSTVALLMGMLIFSATQNPVAAPVVAADRVTPDRATANVLRKQALAAIQDGEYDKAVALTTQALEVAPETGDLQQLLAIVTDLRDSRMGKVEAVAVVEEPDSPRPVSSRPRSRPPAPSRRSAPATAVQPVPEGPPVGIAVITSTPMGLEVEIAGVKGTTPFRADEVPAGIHQVAFYRDSELVHTDSIEILADELELLDVELDPEPEEAPEVVAPPPAPAPSAIAPPPASTGPTEVYVFVPTSVKARVVQDSLAAGLVQMNVTAFGSYRDFDAALRSSPPHAVVAPVSVLNAFGLAVDLRGRDAQGSSTEPYVLLSRQALELSELDNLTIGMVDLAGRQGSSAFLANRLGVAEAPSVKRVSEQADLLPLLQFGTADAVLLPQAAAGDLRASTKMELFELLTPYPSGLPAVSVLEEARSEQVERAFGGMSTEVSSKVGVNAWSR